MNLVAQIQEFHALASGLFTQPSVRVATLTIYYLGILAALVALYGQGNFSTPPFIYQNF